MIEVASFHTHQKELVQALMIITSYFSTMCLIFLKINQIRFVRLLLARAYQERTF